MNEEDKKKSCMKEDEKEHSVKKIKEQKEEKSPMKEVEEEHSVKKKMKEETEKSSMKKKEEEKRENKIVDSRAAEIAASTVLSKISYLQTEKPELLLGMNDEFQILQRVLQRKVINIHDWEREMLYDLEDVVNELLIRSVQLVNRCAFIQRLSTLVHLPKQLFYVLAVVDLIHRYKLWKLLEHITVKLKPKEPEKPKAPRKASRMAPVPKAPEPPKPPPKPMAPEKRKEAFTWQWQSFYSLLLNLGSTVVSPVKTKLEALTIHKQLSSSLRKQAMWLRDEFSSLEYYLQDVDSKRQSDEEMAWIDEVCDVCRLAENVASLFIDEQQMQKGILSFNKVWSPKNFISKNNFAKQMYWLKDKICNISSKRRFLRQKSRDSSLQHQLRRPSPCIAEQLDIISFEEDVDAIIAKLLNDDLRCLTISIVGVGGIGKTSLAKLIYENKAIKDQFAHRIWMSGAGEKDIRKHILGVEGLDPWGYTYQDKVIENAIFVDKRYLIVLDDSSSSAFWNTLSTKAFRNISNGTRIIFTIPHLHESPPVNETNFTYRLHLRSDEKSWALFAHTLKMKIPLQLRKNILGKCGGLPKVIVKLRELLSQESLEEWPAVLDQLIQDEEPWSEVLQGINEYLPLYPRRCLFHFGLFPVGFKIPARRLTALWVAEGLRGQINHIDDNRSPEYLAEMCLRELVNCNMVQVIEKKRGDKIKTCCLPEALRLHWFSRAKETNNKIGVTRYLTYHLDQKDAIFDYIHGNNTNSPYSCCRDITSFLSFDTRESKAGEDIGNFLDRCMATNCLRFLWILDLEHVYRPKLPKAVDQLTQLRYLGLRWTYLEVLPMFIGKLRNLETLDLKGTCIKTIPSSIWMMQNLINLLLDEKSCSVFVPPQDNSTLVRLQTLRGVFINEDSPLRNGLDTLLNIRKLGLKCKISIPSQEVKMSSQLIHVANWISNLRHLEYLKLKSFDENGQPWDLALESLSAHVHLSSIYLVGKLKNQHLVSKFPKNLIDLTLSASGLADDPMQELAILPNLRIVKLFSRSFTGKKMVCNSGGFPKLEVLKLWELELLEEWNVEEAAMPCLAELEIRRCGNLKMIPDGLSNIKTLREVKLTGVPTLASRIKKNQGVDWHKIAHVRQICVDDNHEQHNK